MNNSATTRMISKIALEYNGNDKGMAIAAASNFLLSSNPEHQYQEMKTVADRNSKVKKWALTLGYNIEEINAFSQKLYKRQSFLLKGLINKQKDVSLLEKASLMIQKALETYQNILTVEPNHADALHNVGYINLVEKKSYQDALTLFTKAIQADTNFLEAYFNRGITYEKLNDPQKAKQDFKKVLEIQPNHKLAKQHLR